MDNGYRTNQVFIVVDTEEDGKLPGVNSMLSLAAVAISVESSKELGTFYKKLEPLPSGEQDTATMEWWRQFPDAWEEATSDQEQACDVVSDFIEWVGQYDDPVFVSHPTLWDFQFVSWYLIRYSGKNLFQRPTDMRALDLPSYISGKFGFALEDSYRSKLPEYFTKDTPKHTHNALDDARGVAVMLRKAMQ